MGDTDNAAAETDTAESPSAEVRPIRNDLDTPHRNTTLEIVAGQNFWTVPQIAALESIGLKDTPNADRLAFLHLCQSTGLDPFRREIYLLGRKVKDGNGWTVRWTPQTGIDGFRHLAEESGVYGGRVGPQWAGEDGVWRDVWIAPDGLRAARVGVIRTDRPSQCRSCGGQATEPIHRVVVSDGGHAFDDERITWAIAVYDEYVPLEYVYEDNRKTDRQQPTSMWRKMPASQLGKCAEAAAIRAAFPRRAAGLYEHAEMDAANQAAKEQEESERDRQRRELSSRSWAAGPGGSQGLLLDGAAPEPETSSYDRTVLLAELEEQAQQAGKTVTQLTTRWAAAHKKNIEDATDAELEGFLAERRSASVPPPAADPDPETPAEPADAPTAATDAAQADHGLTVEDVSRETESGGDTAEPGEEGQQALLGDEVVEEPLPLHDFDPIPGDPETCKWCDADAGDSDAHLG